MSVTPSTFLPDLVNGNIHDGLPIAPDSPLVIDRATRDRLVLHDPRCAPLVRRAMLPEDVRRWHATPSRYLVAMPRGWTLATGGDATSEAAFAALAARHPSLAKFLAPHAAALATQPHGDYWWELPPYPVAWFTAQSVIWPSHTTVLQAAPSVAGAYLLDGLTFTTAPTAFLLGYLGSAPGKAAAKQLGDLRADTIARLPVPQANPTDEACIGALAEQLAERATELADLEKRVLHNIMRDLAPPGATAGPTLAQWWLLSFDAFLAELARRFRGDVPFRYRDGWRDMLNEQRIAHQIHTAEIARLEELLDALVAGL